MSAEPRRTNSARPGEKAPRKNVLGWSDVLRAVATPKTRQRALDFYRAAGFTPDDFGRLRAAREAAANALTRAEDMLELGRTSAGPSQAIQATRRSLELELWP